MAHEKLEPSNNMRPLRSNRNLPSASATCRSIVLVSIILLVIVQQSLIYKSIRHVLVPAAQQYMTNIPQDEQPEHSLPVSDDDDVSDDETLNAAARSEAELVNTPSPSKVAKAAVTPPKKKTFGFVPTCSNK